MTVAVRYYCPHCEAVVALERDAYLADKSVTPYPLEGWEYVGPDESYESDAVDGVRFVCGEFDGFEDAGCGEPFYLNFVRFADGQEIDPTHESEYVEINAGMFPAGPDGPDAPDSGPGGA
ncbi:MAG: hypothetical protein ABEJ48_08240 [Halobacteriales archaeon]